MKGLFWRWQLMGSCLLAIAVLGGGYFQRASAQTVMDNDATLIPLPQSEGNAADLMGTFAKDSAIWLGGVGGDGDIDATESDENPYQIRAGQSDQNLILLPNAEDPDQTRIRLGRF